MVLNCGHGLKTSVDTEFSARTKRIRKLCADRDNKAGVPHDNACENLHKTISHNLIVN